MDVQSDHGSGSSASPSARGRGVRVAVVVIVVALIGVVAYALTRPNENSGQRMPTRTSLAEFRGTGDTTTKSFRVHEGWRIDWQHSGKRFAFAITGDRDLGTVIDRKEPGAGTTSPVGAGTFRLIVEAKGAWSIRILDAE